MMKRGAIVALAFVLLAAPAWAETMERTFPAGGGGELVIDLETGGTVTITGWGRSEVSVTAKLDESIRRDVDLTIESSGDKIIVSTELRTHNRRHGNFRLSFDIKVPDRFNLLLDSAGGSVSITDVEGRFEGETMGGDLELRGIRGELRLSTMGGDVTLRDARVDGQLSTMGGELRLHGVEGDLRTKTMGGDVTLEDVSGDVGAETMGGDVSYDAGAGRSRGASDGPVRLKTMGGEILVAGAPEGAEVETMGGDVRVGPAARYVHASTMGGDILLEEVDGEVKATTMGGDVDVRVVDGGGSDSHDVELRSMSGTVTLVVPDGFSMDVDVEIVWTRQHRPRPEIISDFPLKTDESASWDYEGDGRGDRRKLITGTGVHRGGDNRVVIHTVNGDVRIRRQ